MRKVVNGVALMMHVPSGMSLITLVIAFVFEEYFAIKPFLYMALAGIGLGQILFWLSRKKGEDFTIIQMMWIATIGWFLASCLAGVPFYLIARGMDASQLEAYQLYPFNDWVNALFEGLSGYTSTGLTVTIAESELPYTLQWWRSFLQWIGGIGIVVFVSTFYKKLRPMSDHYSQGHAKEEMLPDMEVRWYKIWWIYLSLSALSILLLWAQGITFWEALNHGMTAISTGGFTINDDSIYQYDTALRCTVIFIMVLGALNFNMFHLLLTRGDWKRFLKNQQHILLVALIISGSFYLYLENNVWGDLNSTVSDLVFQMSSAVTTTGFMTTGISHWPAGTLLVLTLAMLVGGSTASTAGGIKLLRVLLLFKGNIYNTLLWAFKYEKDLKYTWLDKTFSHEDSLELYQKVSTFHFFWIGFFALTTFILLHTLPDEYTLSQIIFESASAFGTTGLSVGITSHELNTASKLSLIATMLVGRLELIPFVVVFAQILKSRFTGFKI